MCKEDRSPLHGWSSSESGQCGCQERGRCLVWHVCLFSSCPCCWADLSVRQCVWGDCTDFGCGGKCCLARVLACPVSCSSGVLCISDFQKHSMGQALWFWLGCFALSALLASSKEEFPWLFDVVDSLLLPLYVWGIFLIFVTPHVCCTFSSPALDIPAHPWVACSHFLPQGGSFTLPPTWRGCVVFGCISLYSPKGVSCFPYLPPQTSPLGDTYGELSHMLTNALLLLSLLPNVHFVPTFAVFCTVPMWPWSMMWERVWCLSAR